MGLLADIQKDTVDESKSVSEILLKLRFLANRLDSNVLEDWVRFEIEGYPSEVDVPDYRKTEIRYTGAFTNGIYGVNVSIPTEAIRQHAGEEWVRYSIRTQLAVVEDGAKEKDGANNLTIDTSNLRLILQDKPVYVDHNLLEIEGSFGRESLLAIIAAIRSRVLDILLYIEKNYPESKEITMDTDDDYYKKMSDDTRVGVSKIINYGGTVNNVVSSGNSAEIAISSQHETGDIAVAFENAGLPTDDAKELASIVADEGLGNAEQPLGERAMGWIAEKFEEGAGQAWGMTLAAATDALKEVAKNFIAGQLPS